MNIDQPSATVLAALIAAIPATAAIWFSNHKPDQTYQGTSDDSPAHATATETCSTTTTSSQSTARRPAPFRALFLIAWGQIDIAAALWLADPGTLSTWSASFIGQGLVMTLLGFWLLLRD